MLVKSQVKYIQSFSDKKFRDANPAFVAEGPKLVAELLGNPATPLVELYATADWKPPVPTPFQKISDSVLEDISFLVRPNQVLGLFKKPFAGEAVQARGILLMLDDIQDPGNLGTMVRTADWFGVEQVLCSRESADIFNPKTVQATMGSIGRVKVHYLDSLVEFLIAHPQLDSYATVPDGSRAVSPAGIREGVIIIGNESRGISESLIRMAKYNLHIPRRGGAESLNAAVAAGIILSMIG